MIFLNLTGLWGHANKKDRQNGYEIYKKIIDPEIQNKYSKKIDEEFLEDEIWEKAKSNVKVHDSYSCLTLKGDPFPSRRESDWNCFVSCKKPCCESLNNKADKMPECPQKCRPESSQNWDTC